MTSPLVSIEDLSVDFRIATVAGRKQTVRAVSGVSLTISPGEVVGVVGETGSGKSTLAQAITGLVRPTAGRISVAGEDLQSRRNHGRKARRSRRQTQLVLQGTSGDLNPTMTVRRALLDVVRAGGERRQKADELEDIARALESVGLGRDMLDRYPHELSGGQHQRVSIARAIVARPTLLILDEPTSGLDAAIKLQIIQLLQDLTKTGRFTMMIVSHDLPVIRAVAHRCVVMYRGQVVESGPTERVLSTPSHSYTTALVEASTYVSL